MVPWGGVASALLSLGADAPKKKKKKKKRGKIKGEERNGRLD
jgi:hypothetical protein